MAARIDPEQKVTRVFALRLAFSHAVVHSRLVPDASGPPLRPV